MGGNQSTAINKNEFTSELAYDLVNKINSEINSEETTKVDTNTGAKVGDVNLENIDGLNLDVSVQAKSTASLLTKYTNIFNAISNANAENGVKLDALTGLINKAKQDGGFLDSNTSVNETDQKFSIATSVQNVTNIASCIVRMAEVSLVNKAELGNITIKNAKNSDIKLEVISEAESQAQSLSDMTNGFKNELENETSTYLKSQTELDSEAIQEGVVDNLGDTADNLVNNVGDVVNNAVDEMGESSRSFIKIFTVPAIIIALVISIVFGVWLYKKLNSTDQQLPIALDQNAILNELPNVNANVNFSLNSNS